MKNLSYKELKQMEKTLKVTNAKDYWKSIVLGFITNIIEVGDYNYKITEEQLEKVVIEVWNNDTIWEVIDEQVSYELLDYRTTEFDDEEEEE